MSKTIDSLRLNTFSVYPQYQELVTEAVPIPGLHIADSEWEYNGKTADISLRTKNECCIEYNGKTYSNVTLLPLSIQKRLIDRDKRLLESELVVIHEKPALEYHIKHEGLRTVIPFDEDITTLTPDKIEIKLAKLAYKHFGLNEHAAQWLTSRYHVQTYDAAKDVYTTYADVSDIHKARNLAGFILNSKMNYDELLIFDSKENHVVWRDSDTLTFRLYMDVEFNRELTDEDWVGYEGFTFSFKGFPNADFDFEECEGGQTEDKSVVELCGKNPDHKSFPDTLFLTREMLSNVESIDDIQLDYTDDDSLYPVRVKEAAFVIINNDGSMDEIPIPTLEGWEFPDAKEYEEEKEK